MATVKAKTTAKKITAKQDDAFDKKAKITEGGKKDLALDKKRGLAPKKMKPAKKK